MWRCGHFLMNVSPGALGPFFKRYSSKLKVLALDADRVLVSECQDKVGSRIQLYGWMSNIRRLSDSKLAFLTLRDHTGKIQIVAEGNICKYLPKNVESVAKVIGVVMKKPESDKNGFEPYDMIEVKLEEMKILNESKKSLPIVLSSDEVVLGEDVRLKYRYLDLRRPEMQHNLRKRASICRTIRKTLEEYNFLEVETPILFKSTPEGAKEFLVPTGKVGNKIEGVVSTADCGQIERYYALPQSPQQFKQLLMVSGIDRYYQIARCFRNEDLRADRQPEFTQIDVEMSFCSQEDVMSMMEYLVKKIWQENSGTKIDENLFPRISFKEAIARYGTDKPDLRYDMEIRSFSDRLLDQTVARETFFSPFFEKLDKKDWYDLCELIRSSQKEAMSIEIKIRRESMVSVVIDDLRSRQENYELFKHISFDTVETDNLSNELNSGPFFIAVTRDSSISVCMTLLGKIRSFLIRVLDREEKRKGHKFVWVTDFPLFKEYSQKGAKSMHHPFTAPNPDDLEYLEAAPMKVRALHYDLVLNGVEIGGGSIRIHSSDLQRKILNDILKVNFFDNFKHKLFKIQK